MTVWGVVVEPQIYIYLISLVGFVAGHVVWGAIHGNWESGWASIVVTFAIIAILAAIDYSHLIELPDATKAGSIFFLALLAAMLTCSLSFREAAVAKAKCESTIRQQELIIDRQKAILIQNKLISPEPTNESLQLLDSVDTSAP